MAKRDLYIKASSGGGGSATWGTITGTLSSQTDLNTALSAKEDISNKSTNVIIDSGSNTKYPSVKAVYDWANSVFTTTGAVASQITTALMGYATQTWVNSQGFITNVVSALGYTPENIANKQNSLTTDGTGTKYPTIDAVNTGLATKEPTITAGTTAQYWRGDKSWQTLDKTAVGLGNVDNTSDVNKPISTATQTALNAKGYALVANLNNATITSGTTTYAGFGGNTTFATNESQRRVPVSAGTVSNLYIRTAGTMTGSCTITVMKNGSATSMAITIAAGSAGGVYTTSSNTFSVADGDEISLRFAQTTATSIGFYALSLIIK